MIRLIHVIDTNLSLRQNYISNIVNESQGLLREKIQEKIEQRYKISKATLIRDLNKLLKKKLVRTEGKGKNTKYFSYSRNPLLKVFDINLYFATEPDQRNNVKTTFNFNVFDNLQELFSSPENKNIKGVKKSFLQETEKLNPDILKKELERFVIELSWKSSKIEGNTYSILETEKLIKENKKAPGKSKEETTMILNHKKAFDQILKFKNTFKTLSLSHINQLHNILIKNLGVVPASENMPWE